MVNASLFSLATPHLFQLLLSGSQSHLNIPVKFFSEYIEGKHEGKTVTLRSDGSKKTWKVKMEGQRLTKGWKEFVMAYDLRVGDFVVFRHERDMLFHVTALGPSCCEIQYAPSCSGIDENGCALRFHKAKWSGQKKLRNSFDERRRKIMACRTKEPNWVLSDCYSSSRTKAERKKETLSAEDNIAEKTVENRFVKLTPTSIGLEIGKQHLPASFTRVNRLIKAEKIILVDKNGAEWSMELKVEKIRGYMYMYIMSRNDWRIFCAVNEVRAGKSLTLELIRGGANPMLKFCSKMETPPSEAEALAYKRARVQKWSQETRPKLEKRETTAEEG